MSTATLQPKLAGLSLAGKYLAFTSHQQSYVRAVLKIREIVRLTGFTAVPQLPPIVCGVNNLLEKIISVKNLGLRFGFAQAQRKARTSIMVAPVNVRADRVIHMGLMMDGTDIN